MKVCPKCGTTKLREDFYTKSDGRPTSWCKTCTKVQAASWEQDNYEAKQQRDRARRFRDKYGITLEDYDHMLEEQGEVCAICREPCSLGALCVDHDHETGAVRGLLCRSCNGGLGLFKDDRGLLGAASKYLEKFA